MDALDALKPEDAVSPLDYRDYGGNARPYALAHPSLSHADAAELRGLPGAAGLAVHTGACFWWATSTVAGAGAG